MARPRKEIPQNEFEKLCALQCTKDEICGFFEITDKTLDAWCKRTYKRGFSDIYAEKRSTGKISIRRKQFEVALSGNVSMLIWLGKNILNQVDKQEIKTNPAQFNDGFIEALNEKAETDWSESDETEPDGDI